MGEVRRNCKSHLTNPSMNYKEPLGKAEKTNWIEKKKKTSKLKHEN